MGNLTQVGGTHYADMKIEPFDIGMANQYDDCIFSIIKYVSRHGSKGGAQDITKSRHICEIRLNTLKTYHVIPRAPLHTIFMGTYIKENGFEPPEGKVLMALDAWARVRRPQFWPAILKQEREWCELVQGKLNTLLRVRYPEDAPL